jgi:DNA sulfur modification protein DndD
MILDSLILENVGVYAGRQEAHLSPKPGKPVILFGGMNGGGKTTILEGVQLCFYGQKARIASRGTTPYKDYLREAIHRGADPSAGAAVTVRFRRIVEGESRLYEVKRSWRVGAKGIEESLEVWRDGDANQLLVDSWVEYIESYLPSGIAHLFFFDGEQIKELAEGEHAAEILRTAIQTLLGLDIVDRLETDLKVLERRKRAEVMDAETIQKLTRLQDELQLADAEEANARQDEGHLATEAGMLKKTLRGAEEEFRREGGETYARRHTIEAEHQRLQGDQAAVEGRLRELAAGVAPLLILPGALSELEQIVRKEREIQQAGMMIDTLATRDQALLDSLDLNELPPGPRRKVSEWLSADRHVQEKLAALKRNLNANLSLVPEIAHLRGKILPDLRTEIQAEIARVTQLDQALGQLQAQLARIPAADAVARLQQRLDTARAEHQAKTAEHAAASLRAEACKRHKAHLNGQIEQLGLVNVDERFAHEDRHRLLKHSEKVRVTLAGFRTAIIRQHITRLEGLILESLQQLLRKSRLVTGLSIHPETFAVTLTGQNGQPLAFNRLSAGERQLLATSLLWGLARASGRPIPTIIDTPLGRLDSSHRHHLVERYFPVASHQVILLSTDEEIAEEYHDGLKPYVARQFLLTHNEKLSCTSIVADQYFAPHETAR